MGILDAPGYFAPRATVFEDSTMYVYGTSLDVVPGPRCTSGLEWMNKLKKRLNLAAFNTYAVSSRWAWQAAQEAIGNGVGTSGLGAFPVGSTWPVTRRGFAIINTYANDIANIYDLSVAIAPNAMTTNDLNQRIHCLEALLSAISAGSRIEIESGVLTGTWLTVTAAQYSGGVLRYTTTPADFVDVSITFPAVGYVDLIVYATDPATITAAPITIAVDTVVQQTISSATLTIKGFKEIAGATQFVCPAAIRITAIPGVHTVRLTHAGVTGQALYADTFLVPAVNPVPIFVKQDYLLSGGIGSTPAYTIAQAIIINGNRAAFDTALATLMAKYSNAFLIPYISGFDQNVMASKVDGIHPNDRGMVQIADEFTTALTNWSRTATFAQIASMFVSL